VRPNPSLNRSAKGVPLDPRGGLSSASRAWRHTVVAHLTQTLGKDISVTLVLPEGFEPSIVL